MALSDLITRPLVAPLTGFNEAVQVGAGLAEGAEKLRLANEQLGIEQDKLNADYMSKGISALEYMSKTKGDGRRILGEAAFNLLSKGKVNFKKETKDFLLSDPQYTDTLANHFKDLEKLPIDQRSAAVARMQNINPDEAAQYLKMLELQQKGEIEAKSLMSKETFKTNLALLTEQAKATAKISEKNVETLDTLLAKYPMSEPMLQLLNKYSDNADIQKGLANGYVNSIAAPQAYVDENMKLIKDINPAQKKLLDSVLQRLREASNEFPDGTKRADAISKARKAKEDFQTLLSQQKSAARDAEVLLNKKLAEERMKDAGKEADKIVADVTKYYETKASEITNALNVIQKPNATWSDVKSVIGPFAKTLGGESGRLTDQDAARALGDTLGVKQANIVSGWFSREGAEPDEYTLKRLKENAGIYLNTLAKAKEERFFRTIQMKQQDPRYGQYFLPGGSSYRALEGRYPDLFKSQKIEFQNQAVKQSVNDASRAPITVTRSQIVETLKTKARSLGMQNYEPSESDINGAYNTYIKKYGADGVIFNKNK
jgi:hypothetical protein